MSRGGGKTEAMLREVARVIEQDDEAKVCVVVHRADWGSVLELRLRELVEHNGRVVFKTKSEILRERRPSDEIRYYDRVPAGRL